MNRPAVLLATAGIALFAGCTAPIGGQPVEETTLQVEGATVEQGHSGTISIVATNVDGMRFDPPGPVGSRHVDVIPGQDVTSPSPDVVWGSGSHTWSSTQRRVTVELPIRAPPDTPPGRYQIEITASNRTGDDGPVTVTATATVRVVDGRVQ